MTIRSKNKAIKLSEEKIKSFTGILGGIGLLSLAELMRVMDFTYNPWSFFMIFSLIGLGLAFVVHKLVNLIRSDLYLAHTSLLGWLLFCFFFFIPAAANLLNRCTLSDSSICTEHQVISKSKGIRTGNRKRYYVDINMGGQTKRLDYESDEWCTVSETSKVSLCRITGGLGFDIIRRK